MSYGSNIPGFISATGEAVSYNKAQWVMLAYRLRPFFNQETAILKLYDGTTLVYEIPDGWELFMVIQNAPRR